MGGTTTGGTTTGGTGGVADTTRPTVVSVSPANGATGVRANANIVVTFSEPMDPVRRLRRRISPPIFPTQELPSVGARETPCSPSTRTRISCTRDGTDSSVAARAYAARVTTTARDRAGNQLADGLQLEFSDTASRLLRHLPMYVHSHSE